MLLSYSMSICVLQKHPKFVFFTKNTKPNKYATSASQLALYKLTTEQFMI